MFEHTLSAQATHGVITQMWHGGTGGDPRMRVYVDEEVGTNHAAVDYTVSLAHGLAPEDNQTWPWQSSVFARTHITGYFNEYQIPFQKRVRVTIQCDVETRFFYRLGGAENLPVAIGNLQLPPTARLRVERGDKSVGLGGLASLVDVSGSTGLLASVNMFVRSTAAYQEGCFQATVDGKKLWLSSGLEDFFLGAYFHSMPQMELGSVGFHLSNSTRCPTKQNGRK